LTLTTESELKEKVKRLGFFCCLAIYYCLMADESLLLKDK